MFSFKSIKFKKRSVSKTDYKSSNTGRIIFNRGKQKSTYAFLTGDSEFFKLGIKDKGMGQKIKISKKTKNKFINNNFDFFKFTKNKLIFKK